MVARLELTAVSVSFYGCIDLSIKIVNLNGRKVNSGRNSAFMTHIVYMIVGMILRLEAVCILIRRKV